MARKLAVETQTSSNQDIGRDSIRVVVRVRPMNAIESQRSDGQAIICLEDGQTVQVRQHLNVCLKWLCR
jgi:hypothetical protein